MKSRIALMVCFVLLFCFALDAEAKKTKQRKRRYYGPPPTHPVLLWARTLSQSEDREQRKVAAFKFSQYSQPIFQNEAVNSLLKCLKDTDFEIKVLCTKAMGRAGNKSHAESIRTALVDLLKADPAVRNTVVRAFITRGDETPMVQEILLDSLKNTKDHEEQLAHLKYFEAHGSGSGKFTDTLISIYKSSDNTKVKSAIVSALSTRSSAQDGVIELLAQCVESSETPLVLNCLAGLQQQAKTDARAWAAVEKTIQSDDSDVLLATLDVLTALPESKNPKIAGRLVEIISDVEEDDTLEKAVLSLGVCGDHSQLIVDTLHGLLEKKTSPEGIRVAAALVLGKQADLFPEKPKELLERCAKEEKSQSLRTACQLGLQEIDTRKAALASSEKKRDISSKP